jgi:hypothetical protein
MAEPPVLAYLDYSKPLVVYTDASDVGIGAVLLQKQEKNSSIIRYFSRTLTPAERNYCSPESQCVAILLSVNSLKPYLLGTNFTVMIDCQALLTLKVNANFKSRLMRWHLALQQFTFGTKHVKGEENLEDILSRIDLSDLESKSLEYSLESDIDACGSGVLSIALTEEQEVEAKDLYQVLFLVLRDPDALKLCHFIR